MRITMSRPNPATTVVAIVGQIDAVTAPDLCRILGPRLASWVTIVVLDLSRVTFLGSAGLQVLVQAALRAEHTGISLRLVTGPDWLTRVLHATDLPAQVTCHPTRDGALHEPTRGAGSVPGIGQQDVPTLDSPPQENIHQSAPAADTDGVRNRTKVRRVDVTDQR